jgi:hypothetical protein
MFVRISSLPVEADGVAIPANSRSKMSLRRLERALMRYGSLNRKALFCIGPGTHPELQKFHPSIGVANSS